MLLPSGLSPHVWMAAAEHHLEDPTARLHAETPRLVPWSSPGSTRRCLQGLSSPFNSVEAFVQVALILLANFGELRATSASTAIEEGGRAVSVPFAHPRKPETPPRAPGAGARLSVLHLGLLAAGKLNKLLHVNQTWGLSFVT